MTNPREFVDNMFLEHAYDPVKAHEYYMRTRKLKGRKKGSSIQPTSGTRKAKAGVTKVVPTSQTLAAKRAASKKRRQEAKARVAQLQVRLDKLKKVLAELTKEAKARSGVTDTTTTKKNSTKETSSKDAKPKTAAQKREAAKKAKEYREKEENKSANAKAKELEAKIADVREKIAKMKAEIAAAKQKAAKRSKTSPKTASKGR